MSKLAVLALLLSVGGTEATVAQSPDSPEIVIPRKTDLFVSLERSISTASASPGDRFHGRLTVPVSVNDQIVIPVGSYLIGEVNEVKRPGRLKGKAAIRLSFDTVIFPDGRTRRIVALVQSAEGQVSGQGSQEGAVAAPGSQGDETVKGTTTGVLIGAPVGALAGDSLKGAGIGAAVGAATGAIIGLIQRGRDVDLPRGTGITIQLDEDTALVGVIPVSPRVPLRPPA